MKKKLIVLSVIGVLSMAAVVSAVPASQLVKANSTTTEAAEDQEKEGNEDDDKELTPENTKVKITEEQAKATALDAIKGGTFVSIELEDEDGVIVYDVEISSANIENDVEVDANTGVIIKTETGDDAEDQEKEDDKELTLENTKVKITEEQAKATALDAIKGGTFVSIELEDEDGVIVYGVEILSANTENDVKVDANTGVIIKTETGDDAEDSESED